MKEIIKYIIVLTLAFAMVGCTATAPAPTAPSSVSATAPAQSPTVLAPADNVKFVNAVNTAAAVFRAAGNVLFATAVSGDARAQYAAYVSGSGHVFESFENGQLPDAQNLSNALSAYYPTTNANYTQTVGIMTSAAQCLVALIKQYVPASVSNYADYVNYAFGAMATVAYTVADPYLQASTR